MTASPPSTRVFYLDVARAYAIFWVVASHAFAGVVWSFNTYARPVWWVFNLADSIMRLSVPLFIMISGKLLLGSSRDESYPAFLWRRFSKVVPPFFTWSVVYAFYQSRIHGAPFSFARAFLQFLNGPTAGHLYFMYIILGLYLFAPMLRAWVRTATPRDVAAVLLLWLGFLCVQFFFPDWAGQGPGTTLLDYGGYFLLGYWLDRVELFRGRLAVFLAVSVAIVAINAYETFRLTAENGGTLDETFYFGITPLVAVYAGAFFLILKSLPYERWVAGRPWVRWAVVRLSAESYNIYLIHVVFLWLFTFGHLGFALGPETGGTPFVGVPTTMAATFACTIALSATLKRAPGLSRLFVIP